MGERAAGGEKDGRGLRPLRGVKDQIAVAQGPDPYLVADAVNGGIGDCTSARSGGQCDGHFGKFTQRRQTGTGIEGYFGQYLLGHGIGHRFHPQHGTA